MQVPVLFCRADSVYKSLGCDVYDLDRDAQNYNGDFPVIAHPPCRAWGDLFKLAKPREGEKELAIWAMNLVRKNGGVLEHPKKSKLWAFCGCAAPGQKDEFGGWLLPINQNQFGHRAEKKTYLYIVGINPADIDAIPLFLGDASHLITQPGKKANGKRLKKGDFGWRPEVSKKEREATPGQLAEYLKSLVEKIALNRGLS